MEGIADVGGNNGDPFCDETADDFEVAGHERVGGVHFVHHADDVG